MPVAIRAALLAACCCLPAGAAENPNAPDGDQERMKWFKEARFGMFIHWGVYSVAGGSWNGTAASGTSDWIQNWGRIPAADYRTALENQFNPTAYDPESWVLAAKNAGMKYIVITAKHHDGFCLWDSALTDWDVASTPHGKDLLKPLAEACRKHGLKFCLYYSIMDWSHPDYGDKDRAAWRGNGNNPCPDMNAYTAYMKGQLEELLTSYGDVGVLWFDGEWETSWTHERAQVLHDHLRKLQPSVIINDRLDKGRFELPTQMGGRTFKGDFATPEDTVPVSSYFVSPTTWEICGTMNESWGYKKSDHRWKSGAQMVRDLVDVASRGGNLLLNVGPTGEGEIPKESLDRLKDIATWMEVNGESIHGTTESSFAKLSWDGNSTTRRDADGTTRLFLHLYSWPENGLLTVRGLRDRPQRVRLLGWQGEVGVTGGPDAWRIELPASSHTPIVPVVEMKFDTAPGMIGPYQTVEEDGSLRLFAVDVDMSRQGGLVFWKVKLPSGTYNISAVGSCPVADASLTFAFNGAKSEVVFPKTVDWKDFKQVDCGLLTVATESEGEFSIQLGSTTTNPKTFFSFGSVLLMPIKAQKAR